MKEKEIIQGCIQEDRRCQNALYKLYFPLMSSIAIRYSNSNEEAVQHINYGFLKVLQNLKNYDHQFALATWIRNILTNHIIDEFRKSKKYISNISLEDFTEFDGDVDFNEGERKMLSEHLFEHLKKLPKVTRIVFTLYAVDGYKHKEIGTLMGISEGTSKWHVSDARKKLIALLHADDETHNTKVEIAK